MPYTAFRFLILLSVLPTTSLFACAAFGQIEEEFQNLIIDPVLLDESGSVAGDIKPIALYYQDAQQFVENIAVAVPGGDEVASYLEEISAIERRDGQYAPELLEQLLDLGGQYQQQGDYVEAIAVLERAEHISRINFGLYDEGHISIARALIDSYLAVNDFALANDKLQYLSYLGNKIGDEEEDIQDVPLLVDLADSNLKTFGLALIKSDRSAGLPFEYDTLRTLSSGSPEAARYYALNSLYRAWRNYSIAISTLLDNQHYLDPLLPRLEYRLLETTFLLGFGAEFVENPHYYITSARYTANMPNQWNYLRRNKEGYENGLEGFQRIMTYQENNPATLPEEKVRTKIDLADWHLMFWKPGAASRAYSEAFAYAQALGMEEEQIKALFSPDYPLQLPMFTARPNSREKFGIGADEEIDYDGFVDMEFSLSKNGSARYIRILNKAEGTSFEMEDHMLRYLKNSPFRPYIVDGKATGRDDVRMRFYYAFL